MGAMFDAGGFSGLSGGLPFANPGAGAGFAAAAGGNVGGVASAYDSAYNSSLAMNQSNYNNIMSGYRSALAQQTTAQQAISSGYSNLYNDVLEKVRGVGQARSDAINRDSAAALGRGTQSLIDRGLGNSTIQSSLDRGTEADRNSRQLELSDSMASMMGNYMSQLGLAGLGNAQRGSENAQGLLGRQLDFMNSVQAGYPNASMYAGLAQQAGANAGRGGQPAGGYGGGSFGGGGGGPGSGLKAGYVPGGGPYYGPTAASGPVATGGGGGSWMTGQYAPQPGTNAGYFGARGYGESVAGGTNLGGAMAGMFGGSDTAALATGAAEAGAGIDWSQLPDYGGGGDF